jgi:hypothetical protein
MFARKRNPDRSCRFRIERLETRRLMARDMGPDDPDFPVPDDPGQTDPTPNEPPAAVSRARPSVREDFQMSDAIAPGIPSAAGMGNVKTQFSNGTLLLSEDPNQLGSDQKIIISVVSGKLRVASANGQTLIDGQAFKDFDAVTHLSINFGGGSDYVRINDASLNYLNIDLRDSDVGGNGDVVQLEGVMVNGETFVRTGDGIDRVHIGNSNFHGNAPGNALYIDTGAESAADDPDNDHVTLIASRVSTSLEIETGASADTIFVFQSQIGGGSDRLYIDSGAGGDAIDIGYFRDPSGTPMLGPTTGVYGYLDVKAHDAYESDRDIVRMENLNVTEGMTALLEGGDDTLIMNGVRARNLNLAMGAGADDAHLTDVIAVNAIDALMGEDDDVLEVLGLSAASAKLDGGGGNDSLVRLYDNFVGSSSQTGWETINGIPQQTFDHVPPDRDIWEIEGGLKTP